MERFLTKVANGTTPPFKYTTDLSLPIFFFEVNGKDVREVKIGAREFLSEIGLICGQRVH